jgi:hypothetical protein
MTQHGRRFLRALAGQATSGCFLEIGPLFGSSTQAIAAGRRIDSPIHTIDTFQSEPWVERRLGRPLSREAFDRYTRYIDGLIVHEGFAPDVVRDSWSDEIGFYFDDATHTDPGWRSNFEFFSQFFADDAIITGDDFAGGWPDVTRNVTQIAEGWGVGLYIFGRVWAMTRVGEDRIIAAASEAEPVLQGAILESAHGPETSAGPAMCWSRGLHQHVPLSSFRYTGDTVTDLRFVTVTNGNRAEYAANEWIHVPGVSSLRMLGGRGIGFQLCLSKAKRTENTKLFRAGEVVKIPPKSIVVAVRLGMV